MADGALPVLRTPRLELRPLRRDDAEAVASGVGNFDVSRWLSVVPYPYSRADALAFVDRVERETLPVWVICRDAAFCGVCGIEAELGFWLKRSAWRQGYGFEAARAVAAYWFADPGRGELASSCFHDNARSANVLRALGFVEAGRAPRPARALSQDVVSVEMVLTRAAWEARQGFTLFTPRMTIRPLGAGDAAPLSAMASPEVARNLSRMRPGWSVAEAAEFIAGDAWAGYPGFMLGISRESVLAGGLGFGGTPLEIGYFLGRDHWGRGLMTEALSAFLPELFRRFPVTRIAAERFEDNPASGRILEKFGFVATGRGIGHSKARLEPAPVIKYAVTRDSLKVPA